MKATQIKDTVRNISKQFVSWLSIIVIACLAVTAFLGIRFSADSLRHNVNDSYKETNFRDIEILASLLLSEDDIKALQEREIVEDVAGVRKYNTSLKHNKISRDVIVISLNDHINRPLLLEGSYPKNVGECMLESETADELGLKVGDRINFSETDYLDQQEFIISGIATHPDHVSNYDSAPETRYVMVLMDAFSDEAYNDCYSSAILTLKKDDDVYRYGKDYKKLYTSAQDELDDFGEGRAKVRYEQIRDEYQKEIDSNREKLEDGKKDLDQAKKDLDEADEEIRSNEKKLASSWKEISDGQAQLDEAKEALDGAIYKLGKAEEELNYGDKQLRTAKQELADEYELLLASRAYLFMYLVDDPLSRTPSQNTDYDIDDSNLTLTHFELAENYYVDMTSDETAAKIPASSFITGDDVVAMAREWEEGHKKYLAGKQQLSMGWAEYHSAYSQYLLGLEEYENGKVELQNAKNKYNNSKAKLNDAKKEYEEKYQEYLDGVQEYEDAKKELEDAEKKIDELADNRWLTLNVNGSVSYIFTKNLSGNFASISSTFSLLFVFVGALVIYATVGKSIDEQRKLVGTTKALGFFNSEIFHKYLTFGCSATMAGCLLGVAIAYFAVETAMLRQEMSYYVIGGGKPLFEIVPTLIVLVLALLLSSAAVFLACNRMIKSPARVLMQDAAPEGRKKSGNGSSSLSLYSRLIIRNMLSDSKRVLVTIVSVAGSCALILIGLTISHSMSSGIDIQFDEVYRYNYLVDYDIEENSEIEKQIEELLDRNDAEYIRVAMNKKMFMSNDQLDTVDILCGDLEQIQEFTLCNDPETKEEMKMDSHAPGVYVPLKMDEIAGYSKDGYITIFSGNTEPFDVKVNDIFMLYTARFLIMSDEAYREVFDDAPNYNVYQIRIDEKKAEEIRSQMESLEGVDKYYHSFDRKYMLDSFVATSRLSVILLTVMAFIMAYFILLNLVNLFVNQKKRELTIMRINGFTVREVKNYVGREMVMTTLIGIIIGLLAGSYIAYRIILLLEMINCFDRRVYFLGWLFAAAITGLFSALISAQALRKVKHLKLTDI
ncbi:MAG: hypothetical protein IJU42_02690 [Erysipelotrichaceae bacterium]|nr:hypothetical protein [Erysipelotrichaceae bacterium]